MKPSDIIKTLFSLSTPLLLWSCSDDAFNHDTPIKGEEFEGIMLSVPSVVASFDTTRADDDNSSDTDDASEAEAKINTLTILAYPQQVSEDGSANTNGAPFVFDYSLNDLSNVNAANKEYKKIPVLLKKGTYHIYVVANIDVKNVQSGTSTYTRWSDINEYDFRTATLTGMAPITAGEITATDFSGIPMSCNYTSLTSDKVTPFNNGNVKIESGKTTEVYAPLTFAVAKVRMTLINDFSPSLKMADNPVSLSKGANSVNIPTPVHLSGNTVDNTTLSGGDYLSDTDDESTSYWTWQAVWYIPERIYEDEVDSDKAAINLSFNNDTKSAVILNELNRSTFYDFEGNASQGEFILKVYPWTLEELVYTLHGPYFLHVWETKIPVKAGETTELQYESDTEISCISPMYTVNGEDIPLYEFAIKDKKISVSVNPKIPNSAFTYIMKESKDNHTYDFFHIRAGNLMKRIEVSPLDLREYLTLSRENITIDVREIIAGGSYADDLMIYMTTNVPKVKIERNKEADWDVLKDDADKRVLTIKRPVTDADGNTSDIRIVNEEIFSVEAGITPLKVSFKNLNDGDEFWKARRTLTFTVYPIQENGEQYDEELVPPRTVTINVLPNIQNYTIHFKANGWSKPHIYVYQCLEFPANSKYPNVPVAAKSTGEFASLEYSFTGKIAFLGWNVGEYNDPNQNSLPTTQYNFRYFTDDTDSWNWLVPSADHSKHYNSNMDFCSDYRYGVNEKGDYRCACAVCRGSNYATVWPGIMMEAEPTEDILNSTLKYEGWWKFELTGVATPGKALIMFSDQNEVTGKHDTRKDASNSEIRYPAINQVGVPLFDYPDKEGWFEYSPANNIQQFSSQDPRSAKTSTQYRLYWPKSIGCPYIWFNGDNEYRTAAKGEDSGDYYYYDFEPKLGKAEFLFKRTKGGDDKYGTTNIIVDLKSFTDDGSHISYTWEPNNGGHSGKP